MERSLDNHHINRWDKQTGYTRGNATCLNLVVVRTCSLYDVSVHATQLLPMNWVASHLGVRLPATPPPLPALVAGGRPRPCACTQGPHQQLRAMPQEADNTRHWKSLDQHNTGNNHLVNEEMGNLHGQRDHGNRPRRHDKRTKTCTTCKQEHQPPCPRATGEFLWSAEQ